MSERVTVEDTVDRREIVAVDGAPASDERNDWAGREPGLSVVVSEARFRPGVG